MDRRSLDLTRGERRRGRPPLSDTEPSVSTGGLRVPASLYDRIYASAREQRISIPDMIRRAIVRDLERQNLTS